MDSSRISELKSLIEIGETLIRNAPSDAPAKKIEEIKITLLDLREKLNDLTNQFQ